MINKKIILGTVQMGLLYGINNTTGKVTPGESQKILSKAFREGIRGLDTAEAYGNAHQVIGDFHRANPDKIFKIITKIPPSDNLIDLENKIAQYLYELNVNQIEGLMYHSFQSYKNHKESLTKLTRLKNDSFFKLLGVSIYTSDELQELIDDDEIDLIQLPFNLLDNFAIRGELILEAKRKGKTIHARSAFLQGLFFKSPFDKHPVVRALQQQLIKIQEIANKQGVSIASLALGYCLAQSCIDQVIIGVDSLAQLKSNLEAAIYQIDKDVIQMINEIQTDNTDLLNPSLWAKKNF
jgi:aryl-alcohol dehydrogenase-like predicted oxidoreductase